MKADGMDHPFRVPIDGQLVSWWLKLPELRETQLRSVPELFGGNPAARTRSFAAASVVVSAGFARPDRATARAVGQEGKSAASGSPSPCREEEICRPDCGPRGSPLSPSASTTNQQRLAGQPPEGPLQHTIQPEPRALRRLLQEQRRASRVEHRPSLPVSLPDRAPALLGTRRAGPDASAGATAWWGRRRITALRS